MKILFLDTCNNFERLNPIATPVIISDDYLNLYTESLFESLEKAQVGVYRGGGNWKEILSDGGIEYTSLKTGRKSDFVLTDFDLVYTVITGNY